MLRRRSHFIPAPLAVALALALAATVVASQAKNFVTPLSGAAEVPIRDTLARGTAIFQLSPDGTEMSYRLIASNIENVFAAHIHVGGTDVAGPVVVPLFDGAVGGGRFSGVLATGTITSADLTGPLAGMSLDDLIDEITSGNAYVNVHTNDGVAPANTGPGDFPGGEIRGQLP